MHISDPLVKGCALSLSGQSRASTSCHSAAKIACSAVCMALCLKQLPGLSLELTVCHILGTELGDEESAPTATAGGTEGEEDIRASGKAPRGSSTA